MRCFFCCHWFCRFLPWCCSRRSYGSGATIPCRGCRSRCSYGSGAAIPCRGCCSRRSHGLGAAIPCRSCCSRRSYGLGAAISCHDAAIPSSGGGPSSGKAYAYNSKSKTTAPPSTTARRGLPRDTGERDFGVLEGKMG